MVAGSAHGFSLKNGIVWSVGNNALGLLGIGDTIQRNVWINTNFSADSIISGFGYSIKNGEVYSVGANGQGQLGFGDSLSKDTFTLIPAN